MSEKNLIEESKANESERTADNPDREAQPGSAPQETLKDKIDQTLQTLTFREREIIKLRYGLGDGYAYTLEEVGRIFKVTRERVRQIEAKAVRKLQHPVRSRPLEGFLSNLTDVDRRSPEGSLFRAVFGVCDARWSLPPSLFNFATSERCQDAFIAWLIAWACHDHREANGPLHRTGVFFLGRLLGLHGMAPPTFYTHLMIRKYKHIDILVKVNKDIVVLIEDKVDFIEHSGQLKRYLDLVRENCKKRTPVPVYLKTGEEQDYSEIEKAGWKCFLRREMLEVLDYGKQQGVESDIFRDFHARMTYLEEVAQRRQALRLLGAENGTP